MNFYLDERQRKKQRRLLRLKIYCEIAFFLLLIIGLIYVIIYSPLFQIKNIQININGTQIINTDELVQKLKIFFANQSKIASFLGADNILIWNSKKLEQFQKEPEIANLTIDKVYSNREIKINIEERKKFGIWCFSNLSNAPKIINSNESRITTSTFDNNSVSFDKSSRECYWFDKNGVLFASVPSAEGSLINKVDDFSGRYLKIGDLVLEERLIPNLIKIFDVLEKSDLGTRSLKLERLELQEVFTGSSPVIYFSLRIDPNFALAAIKSLKLDNLDKIEYIDLRVENRAYYKPR